MSINPVTAALQPYLLWIKLAVAAALLGAAFYSGWSLNGWRWAAKEAVALKATQEAMDKDREQYLIDKARWEAESMVKASQIESLERDKDTLLATLNGLKLTRTIKVEPNAQGECESGVLDDAFRLRWNATVETAAASAAADRRD
jgi:hypothetical protein